MHAIFNNKNTKKSLHACMQLRVAFYSVIIMYHGKQYIIFIVFRYNGQTGKQRFITLQSSHTGNKY